MKRKTRINKEVKHLLGPKNLRRIAARESAFAQMAEARGDREMAEECRQLMNFALRMLCKRMKEKRGGKI